MEKVSKYSNEAYNDNKVWVDAALIDMDFDENAMNADVQTHEQLAGLNRGEHADSQVVDDNFGRVEAGEEPHEENHTEVNRK